MPRRTPRDPVAKQAALDRAESEQRMRLALAELHSPANTMSARQLAIKYDLTATQLSRRFKGTSHSVAEGREGQQRLSIGQELALAEHVKVCCAQFRPLRCYQVSRLAGSILRSASDVNAPPPQPIGQCWIRGYLGRHPELRSVMSNSTSPSSVASRTPEVVQAYQKRLQDAIDRHGIPLKRVYNMDETGFKLNEQSRGKVIVDIAGANPQGRRQKLSQQDNITAVETVCNDPDNYLPLPPFMIVKNKQLDEGILVPEADYEGTLLVNNSSGFQTSHTIAEWLKVFDKHTATANADWRLLVMDGPGTHCNLDTWIWAYEHQISIVILPPNTTDWLQPLDVAVFRPLKAEYKRRLEELSNQGIRRMNKADFIASYCKIRKAVKWAHVRNGFAKCGILQTVLYFDRILATLPQSRTARPSTPEPSPSSSIDSSVQTPQSQGEYRVLLMDSLTPRPITPLNTRLAALQKRKLLKYTDSMAAQLALQGRTLQAVEYALEAQQQPRRTKRVLVKRYSSNSIDNLNAMLAQRDAEDARKAAAGPRRIRDVFYDAEQAVEQAEDGSDQENMVDLDEDGLYELIDESEGL